MDHFRAALECPRATESRELLALNRATTPLCKEIMHLQRDHQPHKLSSLISLHPFMDASGIIRVGGREQKSNRAYSTQHPVVIHGSHPATRLLIHSEHIRLLHAGPTLLSCSLNSCFHIVGRRKTVRSVTRACVTCRRATARP